MEDDSLHLRRACLADALDILAWRNDPHTRAMFKNNQIVDKDSHIAWFSKAVADVDKIILIAEASGNKLGMIRFDRSADQSWDVSINVSPDMRGKTYGYRILHDGIEFAFKIGPKQRIIADVRDINHGSQNIFKKCGFKKIGEEGNFIRFELIYP